MMITVPLVCSYIVHLNFISQVSPGLRGGGSERERGRVQDTGGGRAGEGERVVNEKQQTPVTGNFKESFIL